MKIAILILLFILVIAIIPLFFMAKTFLQLREAKNGKPLKFKNAVDLIKFIRLYFNCDKQSYVAVYGFVEDVVYDDASVKMGLDDEPHLSVDVHLISTKGIEKITAICMDASATLKKGDFVAVLPIYYENHNLWTFTLVSKLSPLFLGGDKGFLIENVYAKLD